MATVTRKTEFAITWDEISLAVKAETVGELLTVGDEIEETLTTGERVTFVMAGIDIYAERQVIFSLKDCLEDGYYMNEAWTNKGGWRACGMRKYLNDKILRSLPDELRDVITPRTLVTEYGKTTDGLWLFSEFEVFGETWCDGDLGDKHIPYYENPIYRYKKLGANGGAVWWWERSPYSGNSTNFCFVNSNGVASASNASTSAGVCFGFCI
jgi:hypothetical protein